MDGWFMSRPCEETDGSLRRQRAGFSRVERGAAPIGEHAT
jgi:hypothetical protein